MIINPLPNLAKIEKTKTAIGLLKGSRNTKGKQVISRNAPIIYTLINKLMSEKQLIIIEF
jgi:hypothetical protein